MRDVWRRRRLSIGAKWTIRYSAALLISLAAFSFYAYSRVEQNALRAGRVLLEHQSNTLIARAQQGFDDATQLEAYIASVVEAEPYLKFSIQVFDENRTLLHSLGVLNREHIGVPAAFDDPDLESYFHEVDVSANFPYWIQTARVDAGFVQVGVFSREFVDPTRRLRNSLLAALPIVLIGTMILGWWLARLSLRPLVEIMASTRQLSGSRLDDPIPTTGARDELDELARTLDQMRVRIRDSVEKLRHFSIDAAHQLRIPLTKLRSRLEVTLESEPMSETLRQTLQDNLVEIDQLADAISAMLQLASSEAGLAPGQGVAVDLRQLLDAVVEFYEPMANEEGLQLSCSGPEAASVIGDVSWLRQLFANLIENAIRHSEPGGRIDVSIEAGGDSVTARVRDSGKGIAKADLGRIFDRFHRARSENGSAGVGLGLTIASQIARAHGGEIDVESEIGIGSTFSVRFPAGSGA